MAKPVFAKAIGAALAVALAWAQMPSAATAQGKREVSALPAAFAETVRGPRLAQFSAAFDKQAAAWDAGCESTGGLREAFNEASDAWARMEMFTSGPLSRKNRRERISHWPDPRNAVARVLKTLLEGEGEAGLEPEQIAGASIAVQGLPALERLLFPDNDTKDAAGALSQRACAVGNAIARNLQTIAADALAEWSAPETGDLARTRAVRMSPAKAGEAASAVLGDIATGLRILEDRKIPPLFGGKGAAPNEKAAEGWRSHRSERNLLLNVETLQSALQAIEPFAPEACAAALAKLADAAAALAQPGDPNRGAAVIAAINNARYYAVDVLPGELGVALGFNSLDGD